MRLGQSQPKREFGRVAEVVQREVLGERELEHEPAALAVLGDVPDARLEHGRARCACVTSVPASDDAAARRACARPGDRLDELGLAVAVDAGDARRSRPRARSKRDAAHRLEPAVVDDVEVLDLEQRLAGRRRRLVDAQQHLAPDHQPREPLLGRALARNRVDQLPAPEHA